MAIQSRAGSAIIDEQRREAMSMLASGLAREAVLKLADLADKEPFNATLCLDMGKALLVLGMEEQAIVAARHAIELDSGSVEAFALLARIHEGRGQYQEAAVALRRALDIRMNPLPGPADLLKTNVPFPVIFPELGLIFLDFELDGDCENLTLFSDTADEKHRLRLSIKGMGELPAPGDGELVERGAMSRVRIAQALDEKAAAILAIFPGEQFPYALCRRNA